MLTTHHLTLNLRTNAALTLLHAYAFMRVDRGKVSFVLLPYTLTSCELTSQGINRVTLVLSPAVNGHHRNQEQSEKQATVDNRTTKLPNISLTDRQLLELVSLSVKFYQHV